MLGRFVFTSEDDEKPMIRFNLNDGISPDLEKIKARLNDLTPAARIMGEIMMESIMTNFEKGGRPKKWKALAAVTIQQRVLENKWPGRLLVRKGPAGGLMGAISYSAHPDKVVISANKLYARIHQLGGMAGPGRKVEIPARPYLLVQDEDLEEMADALKAYMAGG
jgi:phage virion morphogenesis protein